MPTTPRRLKKRSSFRHGPVLSRCCVTAAIAGMRYGVWRDGLPVHAGFAAPICPPCPRARVCVRTVVTELPRWHRKQKTPGPAVVMGRRRAGGTFGLCPECCWWGRLQQKSGMGGARERIFPHCASVGSLALKPVNQQKYRDASVKPNSLLRQKGKRAKGKRAKSTKSPSCAMFHVRCFWHPEVLGSRGRVAGSTATSTPAAQELVVRGGTLRLPRGEILLGPAFGFRQEGPFVVRVWKTKPRHLEQPATPYPGRFSAKRCRSLPPIGLSMARAENVASPATHFVRLVFLTSGKSALDSAGPPSRPMHRASPGARGTLSPCCTASCRTRQACMQGGEAANGRTFSKPKLPSCLVPRFTKNPGQRSGMENA
jgi:hypothetical protein